MLVGVRTIGMFVVMVVIGPVATVVVRLAVVRVLVVVAMPMVMGVVVSVPVAAARSMVMCVVVVAVFWVNEGFVMMSMALGVIVCVVM